MHYRTDIGEIHQRRALVDLEAGIPLVVKMNLHCNPGLHKSKLTRRWMCGGDVAYMRNRHRSPEELFNDIPPIARAPFSRRILFVGTENESHQIGISALEESDLYRRFTDESGEPEMDGITSAYAFWMDFFNKEHFLDDLEGITVPLGIVATGMIDVSPEIKRPIHASKRLEEITRTWDIPLELIGD